MANLSFRGPDNKLFCLWAIRFLLQLLKPPVVVGEQPKKIHEKNGCVCVFMKLCVRNRQLDHMT